jgi:DNA-binding transcriptional regulator YiaG
MEKKLTGEDVKVFRRSRAMTIKKLSELAGVSYTHVFNLERDKEIPDKAMIRILAVVEGK